MNTEMLEYVDLYRKVLRTEGRRAADRRGNELIAAQRAAERAGAPVHILTEKEPAQ